MNTDRFTQEKAARKKLHRFICAILERPQTTPELQRAPVFDHVPHSTASEVRKKGVELVTEMVEIIGYAGQPARVARYSIPPESRARALEIIGGANA